MIATGAVFLTGAAWLAFAALERNISYFYTPSEAQEAQVAADTRIRLGGLVETGSVVHGDGLEINFRVTDGSATMPVRYAGIVPDLFREGQGVIAQGAFNAHGVFIAETILAKHDENYIPKELQGISHDADTAAPLTN